MQLEEIQSQILKKSSFLCVGLDTDPALIPSAFLKEKDPVFAFNKAVIDATIDFTVAYKPNLAFYEAMGLKGWESLQKTMEYLPKEAFSIADAKRGDIGNTSKKYAQTFFDPNLSGFDFDSVTVAPYMGLDSVQAFLDFKGKWVVLLALTSNESSQDFQMQSLSNGRTLFEEVLHKSQEWAGPDQMMYVVGATQAQHLASIRAIVPEHFLLVPGVGAQGGTLKEVAQYGMNHRVGLLVNSSRGILYAGPRPQEDARREAKALQEEMKWCLEQYYQA